MTAARAITNTLRRRKQYSLLFAVCQYLLIGTGYLLTALLAYALLVCVLSLDVLL